MLTIDNFKIPKESASYIALQRTSYQFGINNIFRKLHIGAIYDKYLLPYVEKFRKESIRKNYFKDLQGDYSGINKLLPLKVESILDIGCGMAGIDLFLYNHYKDIAPDLVLLDKEGKSEIYYGFKNDGAYYNSFKLAADFLKINGVPGNKIKIVNITTNPFPKDQNFDLVISLISWGFHYPVETYLKDVYSTLSEDGVLVIDIRKNTDGEKELKRKFKQIITISEYRKHKRLICKKSIKVVK